MSIYTNQNDGQSVTDQMVRDHFTGQADNEDLVVLSLSLGLFFVLAAMVASIAPVLGGVLVGLIVLAYIGLVMVPIAINLVVWVRNLIADR